MGKCYPVGDTFTCPQTGKTLKVIGEDTCCRKCYYYHRSCIDTPDCIIDDGDDCVFLHFEEVIDDKD